MLIDGRTLPNSTQLETGVAIVGGGVAGITLALELGRSNIPVCVLEGGGFRSTADSQSLYAGENSGLDYDIQWTRSRFLGGSSNCWGGWCRPFSDMDFAERDWVRNSGWPIGSETLQPHYARTREILELADLPFDPQFWIKNMVERDVRLIPLRDSGLWTVVSHYSPPVRLGRTRRTELEGSKSTTLLLHSTAYEIETKDGAQCATGIRVRTGPGNEILVKARYVILAAGGIENARLLLLSDKVQKEGLGNQHDVVGRYFMDHPRIQVGRLRLNNPHAYSRFYDITYHYKNNGFAVNGMRASATIGLTPKIQREEGLLQCHTALYASYIGENWPGLEACKRVYSAIRRNERLDPFMLARMPSGFPAAAANLLARASRMRMLVRHYVVESILEPEPDPDSRVTLSSQTDAMGMRRVKLNWRLGELDKRTHRRSLELIREQVEVQGLGRLEWEGDPWEDTWSSRALPTYHHMGTTRMHHDPRLGVVDTDCKVHGVGNLYVAGSSVFTTGASNMPTFTIVALAARLAEHIRHRYRISSDANLETTYCVQAA
ncbi:MAG: GMC family oxidoreductase [Pseudoxanthomonas sp.]